jgi:hypothetical protein
MPIASVPPGASSTLPSGRGRARQAVGELDGRGVGEAARRERQRVELALDRVDDARMAVADLVDVVAVEVHEPAPSTSVSQMPSASTRASKQGVDSAWCR